MPPRRIARTVLVALAALAVATAALLARGPLGIVVSKDFVEQLHAAVSSSGSTVSQTKEVAPESVQLEFFVSLRRTLKVIGASIGVILHEDEYASAYTIVSADGKTTIHCLSRFRGDHALGIVVEPGPTGTLAAVHLRDVLITALPNLPILLTGR